MSIRQSLRAGTSAAVDAAENIDAETVAGFGAEWSHFDQTELVGERYDEQFRTYFDVFKFDDLPPRAEGFDLGCGSGRWAAGVAPKVGKLHCIDPSAEALDVARRRLAASANVDFHLASASTIPLADDSQDFGYALGVLHHIPDPAAALAAAVRKLKPGAPFLLYIYYKLENRPIWYRAIWRGTDPVRRLVCRLPFGARTAVTSAIAAAVYWPLARISRLADRLGFDVSNFPLSSYRDRSFYTMRTDSLDRFGTRLEQRFSRQEIESMMRGAGLADIEFGEGPPYWLGRGKRRTEAAANSKSPFTVTVVIPLYNKEGAIECTLKSVLNQTRPPEQLIIVDDGSTDGSVAVVRRILSEARTSIDIHILEQSNEGVSAARNRGANKASSAYVAFLDADDEWLPDFLSEMERLATAFPDVGVLSLGQARLNRRGALVHERAALPRGFFGIVPDFYDIYRRGYGLVHTSSVAIRRDVWKRSGGFPVGARKSQDMLLWLKLGLSEAFAHSSKPLSIWHEEHSGMRRRKGAVPHHFHYFLGTEDGRRDLHNRDLVRFLGSNLAVQVASHRLSDDLPVVAELRRLSRTLPLSARLKCWGAARLPLIVVRAIAWTRKRSRQLRR